MTFLNSAILAALTLGLLPILIHLLNRQRFKKIDFPSLRFLRELQRRKMRQLRIRQIILLALRTLAVLFLVLALARPVLMSTAGLLPGAAARSTVVLILDRSASMRTETPDGTRFRQIQSRAQEILNLLKDGDKAQIVWADDQPELFPTEPTSHVHLLRDAVSDAIPGEGGGNLVRALQSARQILGKSQDLHKEVYVLSDFSIGAWPEDMPKEPLLPDDVRLFLLATDGSTVHNIGITSASIVSRIIAPGRAVELAFTARNTGTASEQDRIVSIYLGGRRVAQTRISLGAGESREQRLKFTPEIPGDQVGYIRVEEADDFEADDQRYFVLRVPAQLHVAVAGEDGAARALTSIALNPSGDPGSFVVAQQMTLAQLETTDWSGFDALFIIDGSAFNSTFASRLRKYVEDGRGALVAAGPHADLRAYHDWLAPFGFPNLTEIWQSSGTPAHWTNADLKHPLFEGLFEEPPASLSPDVTKLVRTATGGSAVDIISTSLNIPFLLEAKAGRGSVLFMTSSPDPEWSSLFRTGVFAPLMVSSTGYLSGVGTSGDAYQLTSGSSAQLAFPGSPGEERYEIRGEATLSPSIETAGTGFIVNVRGLNRVGPYELWRGSRRVASLAVNIPPRESDLKIAPEEGYKSILGGEVSSLSENQSVQAAVLEGRNGRELWKLCLAAALMLLIAEMLIARVGKRDAVMA